MDLPSFWTDERDLVHRHLLRELYAAAEHVPCERRAVLFGGLPGANKAAVLHAAGIDPGAYLSVKLDDIGDLLITRELLPDSPTLTPGESCYLRYVEASHLAEHLAWLAMADGRNLLWDLILVDPAGLRTRVDALHVAGYTITGVHAAIGIEESVRRVHQSGTDQLAALFGDPITFVPGTLDEAYHAFYRDELTLAELAAAKRGNA